MLERVIFHCACYRYRREGEDCGIVYHLRHGNIFLIRGNTLRFLELLIEHGTLMVDTSRPVMQFLLQESIIITVGDD